MKSFPTTHADYIRDVAYDYYGERLATCSSDHKIKIYEQDEKDGWLCSQEINAHSSSVQRLDWAHPEFGAILASCSSDLSVNIYAETVDVITQKRTWKIKARLTEAKHSVQDIEFAPNSQGLRLASCSSDGYVRMYQAVNVMDLEDWTPLEPIQISAKDCNCLSWNKSPFDPSQLAIGSQNSAQVWEFSTEFKKWTPVCDLGEHGGSVYDIAWAPRMGRTYHLIATACKDHKVRIFKMKFTEKDEYESELIATLPQHHTQVWRVAWNVTGTVLASSGDDRTVRLWKAGGIDGTFRCILMAGPADERSDKSQGEPSGAVPSS